MLVHLDAKTGCSDETIIAMPGEMRCGLASGISGGRTFFGAVVIGESFDDRVVLLNLDRVRRGLAFTLGQEKRITSLLVDCEDLHEKYKADTVGRHEIERSIHESFERKRRELVQRIIEELTPEQKRKLYAYHLRYSLYTLGPSMGLKWHLNTVEGIDQHFDSVEIQRSASSSHVISELDAELKLIANRHLQTCLSPLSDLQKEKLWTRLSLDPTDYLFEELIADLRRVSSEADLLGDDVKQDTAIGLYSKIVRVELSPAFGFDRSSFKRAYRSDFSLQIIFEDIAQDESCLDSLDARAAETLRSALNEFELGYNELIKQCKVFGQAGKPLSRINEYHDVESRVLNERLNSQLKTLVGSIDTEIILQKLARASTLSSGIIYEICCGELRMALDVTDAQITEIKKLAQDSEEHVSREIFVIEEQILRRCFSTLDEKLRDSLLVKMKERIPGVIPLVRVLTANRHVLQIARRP